MVPRNSDFWFVCGGGLFFFFSRHEVTLSVCCPRCSAPFFFPQHCFVERRQKRYAMVLTTFYLFDVVFVRLASAQQHGLFADLFCLFVFFYLFFPVYIFFLLALPVFFVVAVVFSAGASGEAVDVDVPFLPPGKARDAQHRRPALAFHHHLRARLEG